MKKFKKYFPTSFVAINFFVITAMVGFLICPASFTEASVAADITNPGAPATSFGAGATDQLVMSIIIPDAWNRGIRTADTTVTAGTNQHWGGEVLTALPHGLIGTVGALLFKDVNSDSYYKADFSSGPTELVVRDRDADGVFTSAADTVVDCDGSASVTAGSCDAHSAGDALTATAAGDNLCTNNLSSPTELYLDGDGDCTWGSGGVDTNLLGDCSDTSCVNSVGANWAYIDADASTTYTDGEDLYIENVLGTLTFSDANDTDIYNTGGLSAGDTLIDFPANCIAPGSGACYFTSVGGGGYMQQIDSIYLDNGTNAGVLDRGDDAMYGLGVQNLGTAVNGTDISQIKVWADAGAPGFYGTGDDMYLGALAVNAGNNREWHANLSLLDFAGELRIFVTASITGSPTNGATLQFQIPVYNDIDSDGYANTDGDVGVFMGSTNDGPTDVPVVNPNTETIDTQPPTITSRVTADTNGDGKIDRIIFTADENLNDVFNTTTIDVAGYLVTSMPDTGAVSNDNIFGINFMPGGSYDTGVTPDTQITANTNLGDIAGNKLVADGVAVASTDGAAPVIVTTSPANGASGIDVTDNVVITFSEPMNTGTVTYSFTPDPGGSSAAWSGGNTIATYTHTAFNTLTSYAFQITAGNDTAVTPNALAAGPVPNPFTFSTLGGGGGGGGGLPPTITVTAPNGGETLAGGSTYEIDWSYTGTGAVDLSYSTDGGINFNHAIAAGETNDGKYTWTVPDIATTAAKVKVASGSLYDISDANFTISKTGTTENPPPETPPSETPPGTENPPASPEETVPLNAGDLIKSSLSTSVYYYGFDGMRHLFPNEITYKTWYPDWSGIKNIPASQLQGISLGHNVTIRPGTVLVKIQTDPKTYAVEPNGVLRWVPTETRAADLYGANWAKKIVDVPIIFWVDYSFGSDITTNVHPTGALMKYEAGAYYIQGGGEPAEMYVSSSDIFYIQNGEKRKVTTEGFAGNRFQDIYVLTIPASFSYPTGADIAGAEGPLINIY